MESIPSYYECIVNVSVEEEEIDDTIIAAKKSEFRNIEFFSLAFLKDLNKQSILSSRQALTQNDIIKLKTKYAISSLRLTEFNIESTNLRFSEDHTTAIYCDEHQSLMLELAQEGMP